MLIIEDEQIVASDIARIVEDMGHRVAGMASHQEQSVALAEQLKPGLVLADIRLEGDGDGIAAAQRILESYAVPIVFVTGYPERLLTGGGLEPAFVVAKPFDSEALKVTIAHALATYASPRCAAPPRRAARQAQADHRLQARQVALSAGNQAGGARRCPDGGLDAPAGGCREWRTMAMLICSRRRCRSIAIVSCAR